MHEQAMMESCCWPSFPPKADAWKSIVKKVWLSCGPSPVRGMLGSSWWRGGACCLLASDFFTFSEWHRVPSCQVPSSCNARGCRQTVEKVSWCSRNIKLGWCTCVVCTHNIQKCHSSTPRISLRWVDAVRRGCCCCSNDQMSIESNSAQLLLLLLLLLLLQLLLLLFQLLLLLLQLRNYNPQPTMGLIQMDWCSEKSGLATMSKCQLHWNQLTCSSCCFFICVTTKCSCVTPAGVMMYGHNCFASYPCQKPYSRLSKYLYVHKTCLKDL